MYVCLESDTLIEAIIKSKINFSHDMIDRFDMDILNGRAIF
mgnify:CR=1 FL=1